MAEQKRKEILEYIKNLEDEINDTVDDKFADLEMLLDDLGIRDQQYVSAILDNCNDKMTGVVNNLKKLRRIIMKF